VRTSALTSLLTRSRGLLAVAGRFGVVGAACLVVDLAVFNLVLHALPHKPLTAKVLSTLVSATCAFLGNRHWSFRERSRRGLHREYALFALFNGVGLVLALIPLAVSRYVLDLDSRLADNIAANGVGLVLGTAFRFWSYHRWLWAEAPEGEPLSAPARAA
jgi:putative flippase GtrA